METAASVHHKEHLVPPKSHCVQCLPILLVAVGIAAGWGCETRWAALAGTGCGQANCCWGTRAARSCLRTEDCWGILGAVPALPGSGTVFGQTGGDCPSSPAPAAWPGVWRRATKWVGTRGGKCAESFGPSGFIELACLVLLLQVNGIKINNNNNNRIKIFIFSSCPCSAIDTIIHNRKYYEVPTSKLGAAF